MWTTSSDLARYAVELQQALAGHSKVISAATARMMLTPSKNGWGLGPATGGSKDNPYFSHGGSDQGFESNLVAYNKGDGAVIMTNGQNEVGSRKRSWLASHEPTTGRISNRQNEA